MPVSDLAREEVVTARRNTPVADLAKAERDENVGSVVIEDEGRPVGIVTDRDLAVRVLAEELDPATTTAEDVMTEDLCTAATDDGVFELIDSMCENGVRRIPVVDDEGQLAGIITHDDLSRLLADEYRNLAGVVEAESPPYRA